MSESKATPVSTDRNVPREPSGLVLPSPPNFINQVVNGDCLAVLPNLPSRSVDFVLTDPPYLSRYR